MFFGIPNIENKWWAEPFVSGVERGVKGIGTGIGRGWESVLGLGETEEERKARLHRNWLAKRDREWKAQGEALPFDKGPIDYSPETGVLRDKAEYMRAQDPSISIVNGVAMQAPPKVDKDDEESEFDKYMKMQFLSKLIEKQKAPSPGYATRAGTARSPVATSIMQTHPGRRKDDLLNYIYGPSYGRRV